MKTVGIVGITAEGGALCYKTIVSEAAKKLGDYKHPEILLDNPQFYEILQAQRQDNWDKVAEICLNSINKLKSIGADFIIIPGNSIHFAFNKIVVKSPLPVISIVETAVEECWDRGYKKIAVLGVGITMSGGLFKEPVEKRGMTYQVPSQDDQELLNKIIYEEIVPDKVSQKSVELIVNLINKLKSGGCDAVILGCTELPIVVTEENSPLPIIDTTRLLAKKALELAIEEL
jgi:aspartate racemase